MIYLRWAVVFMAHNLIHIHVLVNQFQGSRYFSFTILFFLHRNYELIARKSICNRTELIKERKKMREFMLLKAFPFIYYLFILWSIFLAIEIWWTVCPVFCFISVSLPFSIYLSFSLTLCSWNVKSYCCVRAECEWNFCESVLKACFGLDVFFANGLALRYCSMQTAAFSFTFDLRFFFLNQRAQLNFNGKFSRNQRKNYAIYKKPSEFGDNNNVLLKVRGDKCHGNVGLIRTK